jgi:hypothetical protein
MTQVERERYFHHTLETEQQQQVAQDQRHRFSQKLGATFEEKLLNSVARDVSLLCMTAHLSPLAARLECASTDAPQTIQAHVKISKSRL